MTSLILKNMQEKRPANEVKSYRPISLAPVTSKLSAKLLLKRIRNELGLQPSFLTTNLDSEKDTLQYNKPTES
jgi:hypothetical protein